jgi:acyl-CoA thioester hydrolase
MRFLTSLQVRWSDLDPNRHVANTAYSSYMIEARMSFLRQGGFDNQAFAQMDLGPAIISEEFHYLRETLPDTVLRVDVELSGLSEDERFVRFNHHLYHPDGDLAVFSRCTFCWISLSTRKVCNAPTELSAWIRNLVRSEDFRVLSKADAFPVGLPRKRRLGGV